MGGGAEKLTPAHSLPSLHLLFQPVSSSLRVLLLLVSLDGFIPASLRLQLICSLMVSCWRRSFILGAQETVLRSVRPVLQHRQLGGGHQHACCSTRISSPPLFSKWMDPEKTQEADPAAPPPPHQPSIVLWLCQRAASHHGKAHFKHPGWLDHQS